jgi:sulfopyruvate decarboxylase TPP-binding subunit
MFRGEQVANTLAELGVTHVVSVPDSTIGRWERALQGDARLRLVRVCREGEAWGVAAGLYLGGARPVVLMQCTGLFESGDSLRNVLHDWQLPVQSIIGLRSYLSQEALPGDTCLVFTEPILAAWQIPYVFVATESQTRLLSDHFEKCIAYGVPGAVLIAEGKG